jgi:GNAT superfamily N-acetyltransferase
MRSEHPQEAHIPGLRRLWQEAFGDTDAFLDGFFSTAFSPERCLCVCRGEQVLSAAYWLDGQLPEGKCAYIYAVATAKACRGQGLAKSVMAQIRETLQRQGYVAAILVPGEPSLADFYGAMGYTFCGGMQACSALAKSPGVALRKSTQRSTAGCAGAIFRPAVYCRRDSAWTFCRPMQSCMRGRI